MDDRNANTSQKIVGWIWLGVEELFLPLVPLATVSLILMILARFVVYLLSTLGIKTPVPETNSAEDAVVLLVMLSMIVVPLLLRITRILEKIARRME